MKILKKTKFQKGNTLVKKYKFCGLSVLRKEKSPTKKKWDILGVKVCKKRKLKNQQNHTQVYDFFNTQYVNYLIKQYTSKEEFVPIDESGCNFDIKTKLIAFYLPQFHTFPENEEWHGKGFTEWTNVTKAIPHFIGHRQPQLPIDVGFYDLSNVDIMKRQVELAKLYGIYGFCFHYYWFSGKRLMEKPIFNWLNDKTIDFPFCLCWANENWSKLWDGGNKEVLMKQELKDGDDEKFADDILPFFLDKRYIRIDDKPLFIVYRPALFAKERFNEFVNKLKDKCKINGINDLYILVANTFGFSDNPCEWGADALVEFPPHNICVSAINAKLLSQQSSITVYDFNSLKLPHYTNKVFRTVFPSWDNTARKAFSGGSCFQNCTPSAYQKWLQDCINYTKKNMSSQEQFVFINAWNEWAEGAHLEPDQYYGYAYLDATKKALLPINTLSRPIKLLVHVHLFYTEQTDYILEKLSNINGCEWDLFVTYCNSDTIDIEKIKSFKPNAAFIKVANRGYDVWPFIQVLRKVELNNYDYIIKLHTKNKYNEWHLVDGIPYINYQWRDILFDTLLLTKKDFIENFNTLINNPKLGMLACKKLSLPCDYGTNDNDIVAMSKLIKSLNLTCNYNKFVAGTMFVVKSSLMQILRDTKISENNFSDCSQTMASYTLAHQLERLFGKIVNSQGYDIWEK